MRARAVALVLRIALGAIFVYSGWSFLFAIAAASAADQQKLPWYMQETAMTADGRLTFLDKPWWPRAKALKEGESFTMDLNHDGRPDTIVTRKEDNLIEAIDASGLAANIWSQASTAYVVSYKGTGLVDRMVIYIDNNGDGKADEMELRHFPGWLLALCMVRRELR